MAGRMVITGTTGFLGRRVASRAAAAGWAVVGTYLTRPAETADQRLDVRAGPAATSPADVRLRLDEAQSLLRTRLRGVHEFML